MTTAAHLRQRITIEQYTVTDRNEIGGEVKDWAPVATVWASVEPIRGREFFAAQQVNAEVTHKVTTRFHAGITPKMRVKYGARVLEIQSVIDPQERHLFLELMCVERVTA